MAADFDVSVADPSSTEAKDLAQRIAQRMQERPPSGTAFLHFLFC